MKKYCYFNGKIILAEKIKVSPYDLGILRGYGVFDLARTCNGKPFLLKEHFVRLKNSAKELGLKLNLKESNYKKIVEKLLELNDFHKNRSVSSAGSRNDLNQANIRTVLTGGISENAFSYNPGKETFYVLIEKFKPLPEMVYKKGAGAITLDYQRVFPRAKVTNYAAAIKNQKEKEKRNALEIIYTRNGNALEASTSNFFIFKNGALITPKDNILLGITRNLTVKLAKKEKFKVEEREVKTDEIYSAEELFLTATNKGIAPITKVDGKKIGNGRVGKNTKVLTEALERFMESY